MDNVTALVAYSNSGTSLVLQGGSYTLFISFAATQANPTGFQTSAVLLSPANASMGAVLVAVTTTTPTGSVPAVATVFVTPMTTGNVPSLGQTIQVTFPVRVRPADQVPWLSTREQGLNVVPAVAASQANPVMSASMSATTVFTIGTSAPDTGIPMHPFAARVRMAPASDATARSPTARPQEAQEDAFQLPLYRVADRSELGGVVGCLLPQAPAAALPAGNVIVAPTVGSMDRCIPQVEKIVAATRDTEVYDRAGWSISVGTLLQVVTVCVVYHAVHSTVVQKLASTVPALSRKREASPDAGRRAAPGA
jgi:hypothetical protein